MKKRKTLLISLSLALLVSSFLIIKLYPSSKKGKEVSPTPKKLTNLEIAKKVLGCLDKTMRDERGVYALGKECESTKSCRITIKDNRVGLAVMWARTKYIEKTGDQKEKEILMKDIDLYLDYEKVRIITPIFWARKFLYEMNNSKIFSETEKEKIQELWNKLSLPDSTILTKVLKEISSKDYQRQNLLVLLSNKEKSVIITDKNLFKEEIILATEFLNMHLWDKKEDSFKTAEDFFYRATRDYFSLSSEIPLEEECLLGLASSEFYKFTNQKAYLDLASSIFEKTKIEDTCFLKGTCPTSPSTSSICGLLSESIYKVIIDESYRNLKGKIIDNLINENFDFIGYPAGLINDGCFYDSSSQNKNRDTKSNGLVVGLLSESE